jgi:hypothetical protein
LVENFGYAAALLDQGFGLGHEGLQAAGAGIADVGKYLISGAAVVYVTGHGLGEGRHAAGAPAAVAKLAAGDEVCFVVAAALVMGFQVIQAKDNFILDPFTAPGAGHAVPQVNREAFFLPYPVHALPVAVGAGGGFLGCFQVRHLVGAGSFTAGTDDG